MLNPFTFIRNRIREAVLDGFADGLAVISSGDVALDNAVPPSLVERLKLPALPASEPEEPETNGRKRKVVVS